MGTMEDGGSRATARGWEGGAGLEGQLGEELAGAGMGDAAALERRREAGLGAALDGESVARQAVQSRAPRKVPLSAQGHCGLRAVGPALPAALAGGSEVSVLAVPGQSRGPPRRVGGACPCAPFAFLEHLC